MRFKQVMLCAVLAFSFAVLPSSAQDRAARFNVPFAFSVGHTSFPAGQYRTTVDTSGMKRFLLLQNLEDSKRSAMVLFNLVDVKTPRPNPTLVFSHTGDQYALVEADVAYDFAAEIVQPKQVRAMIASGSRVKVPSTGE